MNKSPLLDIDSILNKSNQPDPDKAGMLSLTPRKQAGAETINEITEALLRSEDVHFYTNGAWSMHELLIALTGITEKAHVYISTYAMSETAARALTQLKEMGIIRTLHCLIDNRTDTRSAGSLQLLQSISDSCTLASCHAKATVIKGSSTTITVMGSANYTENNRLECGYATADVSVGIFYKEWITKAIADGRPE